MSNVDFEKELNHIRNAQDKIDAAKELLRGMDRDDPPDFSWLITGDKTTVQCVRIALGELATEGDGFTWIIKAKCNEWGDEYKPGDSVYRSMPISMKDRYGHPVSGEVLSGAIVDGSYGEKYERRKSFKLDSQCCFVADFFDAGYFIDQWGYHWKTGRGIPAGRYEKSKEPLMRRSDEKMKYVHYWRFCSLPKEQHEKNESQKSEVKNVGNK